MRTHFSTVKENLRQLLALAPAASTPIPARSEISHRLWRGGLRHTRSAPARRDHPGVVARSGGRNHHRLFQRKIAKATTDWPNTKAAMHSASAMSKTNADAYAGPAPANTDGRQLKSAGCPVKFNEPAKYLAAPAELHWARWGTGQIHHDPPTLTEAEAHQYKPAEEKARTESEGRFIVGTPSHVKAQLQQLATDAQAHEVMTVNLITDHHAQHIAEVVRPYGAMSPESSQRCKQ